MSVNLYDALKSSYGDKKSREILSKAGYQYDSMLSNHNEQVWVNPTEQKLLYSVAGTHNLNDWGTDLWLGAGHLKDTNRYKEADKTLQQAKDKYKDVKVTVVGHSLGGSIAQGIKKQGDELYALDSGYTIGQKTRDNNGESHNLRTSGDIVSLLGANAKHMTTLDNKNYLSQGIIGDVLSAHDVGQIKNSKIFVG